MHDLTLSARLIVAADFKPIPGLKRLDTRLRIRRNVLDLAGALKEAGVCIKVNSALRSWGYRLIDDIRDLKLPVFADLKLCDIGSTLATDGTLLGGAQPELLTVMCSAGVSAMRALKAELPDTKVLGVTVLTSLNDADAQAIYGCSITCAVLRLAHSAAEAGIDGLIASPKEVRILRSEFGDMLEIVTPGIRPTWARVAGDDQNPDRVMTPAEAILAGADRIVVGRPITQAKSPYDAVVLTLEEINNALK